MQNQESATEALGCLARGDFDEALRLAKEVTPADTDLISVAQNSLTVRDEIGHLKSDIVDRGAFGGQIVSPEARGDWARITSDVNAISSTLTVQVRAIARVVTARANGDFETQLRLKATGEVEELQRTINVMGEQLAFLTAEVGRIANEIGTEGRFGGQVEVPGLAGEWNELAAGINRMAANMTNQIRDIGNVAREIASGNRPRALTAPCSGETLEIRESLNAVLLAASK